MKRTLAVLIALTPPALAIAQTYESNWTREVLVTTAGLAMGRVKNSSSIEITNRGPNAIWCSIGKLSTAVISKSKRIAPLADAPQNVWAVDLPDSVEVYCKAETANQVADAATVVNEAPR